MKVTVASCVKGVSPGTQINFQNHMLRCCHFSEEMMMMFCETTLFFSSHCFFLYDNRELDQKKKKQNESSFHHHHFPFAFLPVFSLEAACQVTASLIRFSNQAWIKVLQRCFVLYSTNIYSKHCARELKYPNMIQLCIPMKQLLKMIK